MLTELRDRLARMPAAMWALFVGAELGTLLLHAYLGWRWSEALGPTVGWGVAAASCALFLATWATIPIGGHPVFAGPQRLGWLLLGWGGFFALGTLALHGVEVAAGAAGRSLTLGVTGLGAAAGVATVAFAMALLEARRDAAVRTIDLPIDGLPAALDGLRVVQLSDLHAGGWVDAARLARLVEQAQALEPDLIAVTGDLADGHAEDLADVAAPLAKLHAPLGVYFVTGNHDYHSDVEGWCAWVREQGWTLLLNEHVVVEHNDAPLVVAGVTDRTAGRFHPGHASDPARALSGAPDAPRLLLAHHPATATDLADLRAEVVLAGHTHGGQYAPFSWFAKVVLPHAEGLHRVADRWLFVHRGSAFWGPPLRWGPRHEVALLRWSRSVKPGADRPPTGR